MTQRFYLATHSGGDLCQTTFQGPWLNYCLSLMLGKKTTTLLLAAEVTLMQHATLGRLVLEGLLLISP